MSRGRCGRCPSQEEETVERGALRRSKGPGGSYFKSLSDLNLEPPPRGRGSGPAALGRLTPSVAQSSSGVGGLIDCCSSSIGIARRPAAALSVLPQGASTPLPRQARWLRQQRCSRRAVHSRRARGVCCFPVDAPTRRAPRRTPQSKAIADGVPWPRESDRDRRRTRHP